MYNLAIKIRQYFLLNICIYIQIMVIRNIWGNCRITLVFFSETVKWSRFSGRSTVKCPLYWRYSTYRVIFHIIREDHQLCYVDKSSELLIRKALFVHALTFSNHATMVIWFFYLYEYQRKTIYE